MKHKLSTHIKTFLSLIFKLGIFTLIVFGLKTCVFDHNLRRDGAIAWCKVKHKEYYKNPDKFISYYKNPQIDSYELFIKNSPEERVASLPARFIIKPDDTVECEITYCAKFGLTLCRYDFQNKTLILIND